MLKWSLPYLNSLRYRHAAEQGHTVSQWRLGELLESLVALMGGETICMTCFFTFQKIGKNKSFFLKMSHFNWFPLLGIWLPTHGQVAGITLHRLTIREKKHAMRSGLCGDIEPNPRSLGCKLAGDVEGGKFWEICDICGSLWARLSGNIWEDSRSFRRF